MLVKRWLTPQLHYDYLVDSWVSLFVDKLRADIIRVALWDLRPILVEPVSLPVYFFCFELVLNKGVKLFFLFAVKQAYLFIEGIFLISPLCHFI